MSGVVSLRVLPVSLISSAIRFRPVSLPDGRVLCYAYFPAVDTERFLLLYQLTKEHRLRRMHLKVEVGTWQVLEIGPYAFSK